MLTWKNDRRKLHELLPWPRNPRQITDEQAERLALSVEDFGQVETLAIGPNNEIYNGHQRLSVLAGQYGMDHEVDVRIADRALTEKERERLTVFLHKSAAGDWDWEILVDEFEFDDLVAWGFPEKDLLGQGFEGSDTGNTEGDTQPELSRADALQAEWRTETGQLWQIGEHRLIIGDCTDVDVVARLMEEGKASLVFTDPPYNVSSHGTNYAANAPTQKKTYAAIKNADWDKNFEISSFFSSCESAMGSDCAVYICTSHWMISKVLEWMWSWSDFCYYCVWCKPNPAPSLAKRHWTWATELIPYAVRGKHAFNFPGNGHALNWWELVSPSHTTDHPTEKPIPVPEKAILHSSNSGDIVFDPFAGSGTTGIACANLDRQARLIEISPAYGAVILQRMKDHTSIQPELVA